MKEMVLIRMSQKSCMNPEFEIGFKGYVPPAIVNPEDGGFIGDNEISCNDVLFGRGGKINQHAGNIKFREIVCRFQAEYCDSATKKIEKAFIAAKIVDMIRCQTPPGRFLKMHEKAACWVEVGDERARKKTGQALRDGLSERKALNKRIKTLMERKDREKSGIREDEEEESTCNSEMEISKRISGAQHASESGNTSRYISGDKSQEKDKITTLKDAMMLSSLKNTGVDESMNNFFASSVGRAHQRYMTEEKILECSSSESNTQRSESFEHSIPRATIKGKNFWRSASPCDSIDSVAFPLEDSDISSIGYLATSLIFYDEDTATTSIPLNRDAYSSSEELQTSPQGML